MTFLVKLHKHPGKHWLTHHVLHFLESLFPQDWHSADLHQFLFKHFLWPPYWLNLFGNIQRGTHILLRWGFWIFHIIVQHCDSFFVRLPIGYTVIVIIQVSIPVKPISGVWNAVWCAILITVDRMAVDSFDSGDIQYMSMSSREVLCRHCW